MVNRSEGQREERGRDEMVVAMIARREEPKGESRGEKREE